MTFALTDWLMYTMWAVFGLMMIDALIGLIKGFWKGSLSSNLVLDYLKDILYYILPLNILISLFSIDPTGWILVIFYFVAGIALVLKYATDIINKFK